MTHKKSGKHKKKNQKNITFYMLCTKGTNNADENDSIYGFSSMILFVFFLSFWSPAKKIKVRGILTTTKNGIDEKAGKSVKFRFLRIFAAILACQSVNCNFHSTIYFLFTL